MFKALLLSLFAMPAFAGIAFLNAPTYPWEPGIGHSNVTQAFATGFDAAGNIVGVCTYYNSRGRAAYATCSWDAAGEPLSATPIVAEPPLYYGPFTLVPVP